ncbi:MAG: hypothetical protein ABI621_05960 [Chloroflexota bacterium]
MNTIQKSNTNYTRVMWIAVTFALLTTLAYVLMAFNVLDVGDLQVDEKPAGIIYVAAGCYLLGGLLILVRRRWLWMFGAGINALVILFFFNMYQGRPAVMFSPGGLVSKIAQILLELALLYIIAVNWRNSTSKVSPASH